ncbi:MAG: AI-2E family transporter [Acidobacteriota bacterium]
MTSTYINLPDGGPRQRGARFLLVTASLVIVVAGLRELKPIALPILIAVFLSVLSSPLFSWLDGRVHRALAVIATVLANLAVLVVMGLLVGGSMRAFTESLPSYQVRFEDRAAMTLMWLDARGVDTSQLDWLHQRGRTVGTSEGGEAGDSTAMPPSEPTLIAPSEPLSPQAQESLIGLDALVGFLSTTLWSIASVITMTLLVVLLMVFLLFEATKLPRKLEIALGWTPAAMGRMSNARREVQRYLVYKTLISLGTGVIAGVWVAVLGVNFPVLWGLIAFLLNYIPSLGSIIAAFPPVLLAWIDRGVATALLVMLGYLLINITLGNFVEPHLMGRRLGISTLVVFLSLVFWGWMWGPVGMLLSVPLTMVLRIALENTEDLRWVAQLIAADPSNTPSAEQLREAA